MVSYGSLNIGIKIKKIRELNNLSMTQVADKLDLSARMYANIEAETSSITLERLVNICNVFECTLEELLGFSEKNIFNFQNSQEKNGTINQGVINEKELIKNLLDTKDELIDQLKEENKRLLAR
jgi:transcriptional regulator with XRE-family HTH domain